MFKRLLSKLRGSFRTYDGAKTSARFGDFSRSGMSANSELEHALPMLRNRARGLYRNDPHVRRWVNQLQTNVVGDLGFKLQVKARHPNGTKGMDTYGNAAVEDAWMEWSRVSTADGMMSFRELCRQVVRTWARDGEFFAEIVEGNRFTHGMALHAFEADIVDDTLTVSTYGKANSIRQGVEIDQYGKPVAYHLLHSHPGDTFSMGIESRKHRRVPAEKIIHVFIKDRPHQVRGEPPLAPVMTATKMLSGYREAEVTGRRVAASKMGFFTRLFNEGQGDIAPLATTEAEDGSLEMEVQPGRLTSLPPGVGFEKFDMTTFSTDYEQFERQILRSISAGLDIAYGNLSMDSSNSSYSTDRSDQIKQRDVWRGLQCFIIETFVWRVYSKWNENVFDFATDLKLPRYRAEKFLKASYFTGRGWSWVDPEKEIKAAKIAVDNNMTSLTRIAAEQGRDIEEVFKEIQSERELATGYGIDLENQQEEAKVAP